MASALRRLGAARASLSFKTLLLPQSAPPPTSSLPPKQPTRFGSYKTSPNVQDLSGFSDYEVVHKPVEWSHVENLLFRRTVPPIVSKESYPSGWSPPKLSNISDLPYFVDRSCNHMIPVYMHVTNFGSRKITSIKHVKGDIEQLETEIRQYLVKKNKRVVATCINECGGTIRIKGDFASQVKNFLERKGF